LESIYFNPSHPAAYSSPAKLYKVVKQENKHKVNKQKIIAWMQKQDSYSLNRFAREKKGGIRKYVTGGLNTHWQSDLADVSNISQYNDNYRFLLIVIDAFSRYLWVAPLLNKRHDTVINAFKLLFPDGLRCKVLTTDHGGEYVNRWFANYLKEYKVYHHTSNTVRKAPIAERVISTLKGLLYRYFTYRRSYYYLDVLQDLVENYNGTPHRSLNYLSPSGITTDNEAKVWKDMYITPLQNQKQRKLTYKFNVGDYVRVSLIRGKFARSYQEKWSREINIVKRKFHQSGIPTYQLTDYNRDDIDGNFYESELQKVNKQRDDLWIVDKVLKHRKYRGKKQSFVHFEGWRDKFNEWVDDKDIQDLA
jgi:hypothetical protein